MFRILLKLSDLLRHRARRRRWNPNLASGRRGEDLAHRFLQDRGMKVVCRNFHTRSRDGEIDLVAWDGDTLAFVEVKSRATEEFGTPDRAIDRDKQIALLRAGREYARRAQVDLDRTRFDVVNVILSDPPLLTHVPGAIRLTQAL